MAVAFDAVGVAGGGGTSSTTSTVTWSHISVGTAGLAGVVSVSMGSNSTTIQAFTLTATWGGVTMTSLGKIATGNSTVDGYVQLFGIIAPPTGTQTVLVTCSGTPTSLVGGSVSYTGAGAFGTGVTAFGNSAAMSVTVTGTNTANMFAVGMCCGNTIGAASGVVTRRWLQNFSGATGAGEGAQGTAPGAVGATALTWVITTSNEWGAVGVEVIAAGALPLPVININQVAVTRAAAY